MKRYDIKVIVNSKKEGVYKSERNNPNELIVRVKKPPIKGKANIAVINLLKKYFKSDVKIVKGNKSRKKVIEVNDNKE